MPVLFGLPLTRGLVALVVGARVANNIALAALAWGVFFGRYLSTELRSCSKCTAIAITFVLPCWIMTMKGNDAGSTLGF